MTQDTDLQGMVLAFAATLARRCIEAVESGGLTNGNMQDSTSVGAIEWHFDVTYGAISRTLRIEGHPNVERQPSHPMELIFGMRPDEDAFTYVLPADWLPPSSP